jgi:hypothetical protein
MTKSKKPDSLTEAGKNAKTELSEQQLQDISGGPIYMDRLQSAQVQLTDKASVPTISLNVAKP